MVALVDTLKIFAGYLSPRSLSWRVAWIVGFLSQLTQYPIGDRNELDSSSPIGEENELERAAEFSLIRYSSS